MGVSSGSATGAGSALARQWRVWLGIAISAVFLFLAVRQVGDFGVVGTALRDANYLYVIPALGVYFFGVWLRAARWHYLLRPLRPVPASRLFPVVVIGYMANDVLPARLGELVRAYVLGEREDVSKTATLATIAVERTFDGVAMLIFVGGVVALAGVALDAAVLRIFQVAVVVFAVALVGFFAVASSRERALRLIGLALRVLPERARTPAGSLAERFLAGLSVMQSPALLGATLALSLGAWLAEATMYWLIGLGFGFTLGPAAYLLTTAVANLAGMVPSSPGYVGTFDLAAQASLGLFGLAASRAFGYVIVLHLALWAPVTLLGFVYLWRYGFSLRSLGAGQLSRQADQLNRQAEK